MQAAEVMMSLLCHGSSHSAISRLAENISDMLRFGCCPECNIMAMSRSCQLQDLASGSLPVASESLGRCTPMRHCVLLMGCAGQQFMYGSCTLRGHLLAGEERFAVRWNRHDDSVW